MKCIHARLQTVRIELFHIDFKSKVLITGTLHPSDHVFYLHQICALLHVAKNKVKGSFIAPDTSSSLFLSLLWDYSGSQTTDQTVPRFFPVEEISVVDQHFL